MCQLPFRLDWLWFCEMDLDATIPNHSVLSKARRRWGIELFEAIFNRVLECCQSEGLIDGSVLHVDSTLLKPSASKSGRVSRKLWHQLEEGLPSSQEEDSPAPPSGPSDRGDRYFDPCDSQAPSLPEAPGGSLNRHIVSPTAPDAATFSRRGYGTILGYRDHRLVDDQDGIIVSTMATPADYDDGSMLPVLLKENRSKSTKQPEAVVGDSMYGTHVNYEGLSAQGIKAYLKKRRGKDSAKTSWIDDLPSRF